MRLMTLFQMIHLNNNFSYTQYIFLMFFHVFRSRDGKPIESSGRFQINEGKNAIQLALEHVQKEDAGHYTLFAKSKNGECTRKDIQLIVDDRSYGEDPPLFLRRLGSLSVKVGTRTRLLVEIRSTTDVKVGIYGITKEEATL